MTYELIGIAHILLDNADHDADIPRIQQMHLIWDYVNIFTMSHESRQTTTIRTDCLLDSQRKHRTKWNLLYYCQQCFLTVINWIVVLIWEIETIECTPSKTGIELFKIMQKQSSHHETNSSVYFQVATWILDKQCVNLSVTKFILIGESIEYVSFGFIVFEYSSFGRYIFKPKFWYSMRSRMWICDV